ncbi:hypothetical protein WME88_40600 [Sorangium sp. So ce216]
MAEYRWALPAAAAELDATAELDASAVTLADAAEALTAVAGCSVASSRPRAWKRRQGGTAAVGSEVEAAEDGRELVAAILGAVARRWRELEQRQGAAEAGVDGASGVELAGREEPAELLVEDRCVGRRFGSRSRQNGGRGLLEPTGPRPVRVLCLRGLALVGESPAPERVLGDHGAGDSVAGALAFFAPGPSARRDVPAPGPHSAVVLPGSAPL